MFVSSCLKLFIELALTTVSGKLFQHLKQLAEPSATLRVLGLELRSFILDRFSWLDPLLGPIKIEY